MFLSETAAFQFWKLVDYFGAILIFIERGLFIAFGQKFGTGVCDVSLIHYAIRLSDGMAVRLLFLRTKDAYFILVYYHQK
jgi:hypothetical protein